ncbi:hypothetical protein GCM10020295_83720 [Streptomyces cinereospinus]
MTLQTPQEILMDTHEGKAWNTFFMHLTSVNSTMNMHCGRGGWSLHEVYQRRPEGHRRGCPAAADRGGGGCRAR